MQSALGGLRNPKEKRIVNDIRPSNLTGRALEIFEEVRAGAASWSAIDQGRLAHACGKTRESNPWSGDLFGSHANCRDWYRGWDTEASRLPPATHEHACNTHYFAHAACTCS